MKDLSCFKSYDIRGKVPEQFNADIAFEIGKAFVHLFKPDQVVVGHDVRLESPALSKRLIEGITAVGADVVDIGVCGTEEVYFHTFHRESAGVGGGIMVTASHNPKGYNGIKMVGKGSKPISSESGLEQIRDFILAGGAQYVSGERSEALDQLQSGTKQGKVLVDNDKSDYIEHLLGYIHVENLHNLKILADPGNGPAGAIIDLLARRLPMKFVSINNDPDGNFPNGVPNPILRENQLGTANAVLEQRADFGIAWDGDFDRCFFFDERGQFVEGYYIVGLIAEMMLKKNKGASIIHDPRLIWNSIDIAKSEGGEAIQSKTGHSFMKAAMRKHDAIYGGEMSAHHYFRDFAYCDSGMIPWLLLAELISSTGKSLSTLISQRMSEYPCSGEVNFKVSDAKLVLERILSRYEDESLTIDRTDGIGIEFENWRFNVRMSNTEPLLRLNIESRGDSMLVQEKLKELTDLITRI